MKRSMSTFASRFVSARRYSSARSRRYSRANMGANDKRSMPRGAAARTRFAEISGDDERVALTHALPEVMGGDVDRVRARDRRGKRDHLDVVQAIRLG